MPHARTWRWGAGLLLVALLAAGCGGGQAEDGRTRVVFWHSFVSSTIPALEDLVARFEEEHPEIRLDAQYIPTGDALVQKLITAVRSNTAPDISWIHADYLPSLVEADAIYPMAHFIDGPDGLSEEDLADIYPALLQYASYQGTLYSLPMEATNLGLLYNRELFRQAGLDPDRPPRTWEELVSYSERLLVDRNNDGRFEQIGFLVPAGPGTGPDGPWMVWQWMPFLWQAGGYLIDEEQSRVLYDSEAGVEALGLWKRLYDLQNQKSFSSEYQSAFYAQQGAMLLDGPWSLPNYPRLLRDIDWAVAPLPAGPEKQATVVGGEYLAVFKQSEHPEAAWAFLKWMTRPDVQAFWSERSGYLPTRHSVMEMPEYQAYLETNPALRVYAEQMEVAQAQRPMDYYPLEIQRNLAIAIEKATVGGRDPREVLREAAEASNALLERADRQPHAPQAPPPEPEEPEPEQREVGQPVAER